MSVLAKSLKLTIIRNDFGKLVKKKICSKNYDYLINMRKYVVTKVTFSIEQVLQSQKLGGG